MTKATTCTMTLPGQMLRRGFWLYVWRVESPIGELLYIGRTGDNSSPHAVAPYTRMDQHLSFVNNQNALRRRLNDRGVKAEDCSAFHLIAHGPIYPEVPKAEGADRSTLMEQHVPLRNLVGAMEKTLADELSKAGYTVLNTVKWRHAYDPDVWSSVRAAFAEEFPRLNGDSA